MRIAAMFLAGFMSAQAAQAAQAQPLVLQQQQSQCEEQYRALSQKGQAGVPDHSAFLKSCMSDVNAVATLPGNDAMRAPAGATGVCKDGAYTAAIKREGACARHGGLARWLS